MGTTISNIPLFEGLSDESYELLDQEVSTASFAKEELIFSVGEPSQYLYILTNGAVKLYNVRRGTAKEETVCLIRPKDFFCLAPLINEEKLHINAKALQASEALVIPRNTLHRLIDFSHTFSKKVIRFLARKECDLCEEVCDLSLSTTKERLAKYLLNAFERTKKSGAFSLDLTQSDLASCLGTVRETVSRDLSDLRRAGIIKTGKGKVSVVNHKELVHIAHSSRLGRNSLSILSS